MTEMRDRRQVARIVVPWHLSGRVLDGRAVRILDLSTAGVGIEHDDPLQPGAACTMEIPMPFGTLQLAARVVWSLARDGEATREARARCRYQSGLAFAGLTDEQREALARALETLQGGHRAPGVERAR
jgi:hypothetical protein